MIGCLLGCALLSGCGRPSSGPLTTEASATPNLAAAAATNNSTKLKPPVWGGEGTLREYYLHGKYSQEELDAVANAISLVFKDRKEDQQRQMVAELLSFHYVIFHSTENHDLRKNHAQIRKHRALLEKMAERHKVPVYAVMAITSWENSGGSDKVSWADAAGLGQMTWGAVDEAHRYAARKAQALKEEADWEKYHGKILKDKAKLEKAKLLYAQAAMLNVEQRHRKMAHDAGVQDERAIAECNLEDVVLFFSYLLSQFGGRVDHAIGAYHKGVLNHDDILYDYLRRRDAAVLYPQPGDRTSFLDSLERLDVSYLDLWNDPRSREMLNGLRTVEGERTNPGNKHLALGDETDIYPWKVLGSLSAFLAGETYLNKAVERYSIPQLAGEVRGLPTYKGEEGRREGANKGYLVEFTPQYWSGETGDARQAWIRPELAGYLYHLRDRMARASSSPAWKLPVVSLGKAADTDSNWEQEIHAKGVAVKLGLSGLTIEQRDRLQELIQQDYLFDRIYLRSSKDDHHIVVNPRFGHEFMKLHDAKSGIKRAGD